MIKHSPVEIPRLDDCESPKLVALTASMGLHVLKVTHYDSFDEDSPPYWSTACSEGWKIEPSDIIWWAYADEVRDLVEAQPAGPEPGQGS